MNYPYARRDLFAEPESYSYASCDWSHFLDDWKASRDAAITALKKRSNQSAVVADSNFVAIPEGATALRTLLKKRSISESALTAFIKKYEVHGRLFTWYQGNGRRHPDSPVADLNLYILFAERLCEAAETSLSLKYLSTLLKLCDALAGQITENFTPLEASSLIDILETEASLIDKINVSEW